MIDLKHIEKYTENNRVEAKKALGGLPHSIWETYSAFANTLGGIILLGVEEYRDKSFHAVDLPDPEGLISEFHALLSDRRKVNVNILTESDVSVETVDGKRIVAIRVPRASRADMPVYIDGDAFSGSYRRGGEGDYRCSRDEVLAMLRDAELKTRDMTLIANARLSALDRGTIRSYRERVNALRKNALDDEACDTEFLCSIGAADTDEDGTIRPTAAGLLCFGTPDGIADEFPHFSIRLTLEGKSELCRSNLFDGYNKLLAGLCKGIDDVQAHAAIGEALANCFTNADYDGSAGIAATRTEQAITIANAGRFRIDVDAAMRGGVSDPRNRAITKIFALIDAGRGTGSGIPSIFGLWKRKGWTAPVIEERFDPDMIILTLPLVKNASLLHSTHKPPHARAIISFLTESISATLPELSALLGLNLQETSTVVNSLEAGGIVTHAELDGEIHYKLKA